MDFNANNYNAHFENTLAGYEVMLWTITQLLSQPQTSECGSNAIFCGLRAAWSLLWWWPCVFFKWHLWYMAYCFAVKLYFVVRISLLPNLLSVWDKDNKYCTWSQIYCFVQQLCHFCFKIPPQTERGRQVHTLGRPIHIGAEDRRRWTPSQRKVNDWLIEVLCFFVRACTTSVVNWNW